MCCGMRRGIRCGEEIAGILLIERDYDPRRLKPPLFSNALIAALKRGATQKRNLSDSLNTNDRVD